MNTFTEHLFLSKLGSLNVLNLFIYFIRVHTCPHYTFDQGFFIVLSLKNQKQNKKQEKSPHVFLMLYIILLALTKTKYGEIMQRMLA